MTYEEALKVWASKKFNLDLNAIRSVTLDFRKGYGGGCDTCGYGADDGGIEVWVAFDNETKYFEEEIYEFTQTVREIVEAGQS